MYREFQQPQYIDIPACNKSISAQQERLDIFGKKLVKASQKNKTVYMMGDFNIDLLKLEDCDYYLKTIADQYQRIIGESGLVHMRMGATFQAIHEDGKCIESELDHALTNRPGTILSHGTTEFDASDHKAISLEIVFGVPKKEKTVLTGRDLRHIRRDPLFMKQKMANQNWSSMLNLSSVDEMVEFWTTSVNQVLNEVAPIKTTALCLFTLHFQLWLFLRRLDELVTRELSLVPSISSLREKSHC